MLHRLWRLANPLAAARAFRKALWSSDPTTVLFLLGALAVVWGLALLHPAHTFTLVSFSFLASIAPEDWWGGAAVLCGIGQMAVVINGGWQARAIMGLCDMLFWTFVCLGMALAPGGSPVPVAQFIVYALGGLWGYVNAERLHLQGVGEGS
jgi:hypothetical protein